MTNVDCVEVAVSTPDYVASIFWVFITVLMLTIMGAIFIVCLKAICEFFEDRRRAYLRNKQEKIQLELLEKQKNEIR